MGRSRYRILESQYPHFLTCTILNWIPLFTRPATVQIVLDALLYRQQQHNWRIYGYVILENHMHLLVQADDLSAIANLTHLHCVLDEITGKNLWSDIQLI
jgi:REP element-mobilizing transposase RayT